MADRKKLVPFVGHPMTRSFSVYLDLVRFLAALLVLLYHASEIYKPHSVLFTLGHEAVIVFFILSGYVIAYVADTKEHDLKSYTVSRLARIYSVALPAVALTGLLDYAGFSIDPDAYSQERQAWDHAAVRVVGSLMFVNNIWFTSMQLFSNVPYWSLSYEVWYYIGFAVVTYATVRWRWVLFALLALFLGPAIVLLMPLWWGGVLLYRSAALRRVSAPAGWILFLLSLIGFVAYKRLGIAGAGENFLLAIFGSEWTREWVFSQSFLGDYFLGLCVAVNFVGLRAVCERHQEVPKVVALPIRTIAACTFTLYLLHQPLILFYDAIFALSDAGAAGLTLQIVLCLGTAYVVSLFTEQQKNIVRRWISSLFDWVEQNLCRRFGTHRGLVRLILANVLWLTGPYRRYGRVDFSKVRRLVFVCQGNICRSPFGHHLAKTLIGVVPVCSLGIGAGSGLPADPRAREVALEFGVDLSAHKTTGFNDFEIRSGDLYLVMEDRHLRALEPLLQGYDVQVTLLGLWCRPRFALIYDPHLLSESYFSTCFHRIKRAVETLKAALERRSTA